MIDPFPLVGPVLRLLSPERAHRATVRALALGLAPADRGGDDPILACRVWGLDFANPVGLAAGFDKDAKVPDAMLGLGFGFVEAGTVTPLPQPGNPKPRLFRLDADGAVINRFGFNSGGLAAFAGRLARRRRRGITAGPVGANVGVNKTSADGIADCVIGIEALAALADYLVVNVSSPNTPGLRDLQCRARFGELIERCLAARRRAALESGREPPLLFKIAPDLSDGEKKDIAEVARAAPVDGLIVANTTIARPQSLTARDRDEAGGLSGRPLFVPATECLRDIHRLTGGSIPLIGCGGVSDGGDAYAKIRAGASLVQLYTALVFAGPALVGRIKRDLAARLRADGFASVAAAVGAGHTKGP